MSQYTMFSSLILSSKTFNPTLIELLIMVILRMLKKEYMINVTKVPATNIFDISLDKIVLRTSV
ncbi:hypothetical protein ACFL0D_04470 [Thermoproteota archaeon]